MFGFVLWVYFSFRFGYQTYLFAFKGFVIGPKSMASSTLQTDLATDCVRELFPLIFLLSIRVFTAKVTTQQTYQQKDQLVDILFKMSFIKN